MIFCLYTLILGGCASTTIWHEVAVDVTFEEATDGPIHLSWYQTWHGEGELERPLRPLGERELPDAAPYAALIRVPVQEGDGLSIHAWEDVDGDGLLCAPGTSADVGGIWVSEEDPALEIAVVLALTAPCAPAEALFP